MTRRSGEDRSAVLLHLIGGESTGKSTLATSLSATLDATVVHEVLRSFVESRGRVPRADEQMRVLEAQVQAERIALQNSQIVIGDPAPVMTAVYSQLYYDDDSLFGAAESMSPRSDLVVWCAPDFAWQPDSGQRDGARFREAADAIIASRVIPRLTSTGIDVVHVTGTPDARLRQVLDHLDQGVAPAS
jgi:nicotinamide riboside kinase